MTAYVILKLLWTGILGFLLSALGLMVGMDMGVGTLLRFVGRTDPERRTMLNIIGPHWDGNQVWFVLGGGSIFAAFPSLYGTSFSIFYVVMILLLFSMILRPVAFEYRSKVANKHWRAGWDSAFLISGFVPMFVFGAAFGNVLQGVGYHFVWTGQYIQDESFWSYLLNPFAILCGLMSVSLSVQQGGAMLMLRAEEPIYSRAKQYSSLGGLVAALLFVIGGVWMHSIKGFMLTAPVDPNMPANPLHGQHVAMVKGAWLTHFTAHPLLWLIPIMGTFCMVASSFCLRRDHVGLAWWLGAGSWIGTIGTIGAAMFPFLMPSSTAPDQSLSTWNATGSAYGLTAMLVVSGIFIPLILCYTSWCYHVMRGRVSVHDVINSHDSY